MGRCQIRRIRACANIASMLAGVQQHPNLPRRWPGKNPRKHRAAPNAGVVLFYSRIFHRAGVVEREVLVRRLGRGLPVEVSAPRAGLNPKVHSSVADNCERSGSQSMFVIRPVPVTKYCVLRREVLWLGIESSVDALLLDWDDAPVFTRNFLRPLESPQQ